MTWIRKIYTFVIYGSYMAHICIVFRGEYPSRMHSKTAQQVWLRFQVFSYRYLTYSFTEGKINLVYSEKGEVRLGTMNRGWAGCECKLKIEACRWSFYNSSLPLVMTFWHYDSSLFEEIQEMPQHSEQVSPSLLCRTSLSLEYIFHWLRGARQQWQGRHYWQK